MDRDKSWEDEELAEIAEEERIKREERERINRMVARILALMRGVWGRREVAAL